MNRLPEQISPNRSSRNGQEPRAIVIHHTAGASLEGDLAWTLNPAAKVSYHYLVGKAGAVIQTVWEQDRAWHAGTGHLYGVKCDVNGLSIGIGLVNDGAEPFPVEQLDSLVELCAGIMERRGIGLRGVLGHRDVCYPPGRKLDPHDLFPWNDFLQRLAWPGPEE